MKREGVETPPGRTDDGHAVRRRSSVALCVTAVVLAVLLSACGEGTGGGGGAAFPPPSQVLLTRLPAGLPQTLAVSHDLAQSDLDSATPADPATVDGFLSHSSFNSASVRIWTQGSNYVTLLAVAFDHTGDATRMVQTVVDNLQASVNTYVTPHQGLPGSYTFVISGNTRAAAKNVICEGVWLPDGHYAIETLTCSDLGAWATLAEELAKQESDRVKAVAA